MVSGKERLRLEREWDQMRARMQQQYEAITRLAALNTHLMAGLLEIANAQTYKDKADLKAEAQATLDAAEQMAAGSGNSEDQQDSTSATHPEENTHADND